MVTRGHQSRGLYLREWRKHAKLTQEALGEAVNSSKENISRYESWADGDPNGREPPILTLQAIAKAVGLDNPGQLFYLPGTEKEVVRIARTLPDDSHEQVVAILKTFQRAS